MSYETERANETAVNLRRSIKVFMAAEPGADPKEYKALSIFALADAVLWANAQDDLDAAR